MYVYSFFMCAGKHILVARKGVKMNEFIIIIIQD